MFFTSSHHLWIFLYILSSHLSKLLQVILYTQAKLPADATAYRNPVKCGHPGTNVKWRCDANAFTREMSGQVLRSHFDTDTGQFTRHVNAPLSQQAPKHARAHIIVTKRHTKPPDFTSVTRNLSYLPVHNKRQHGTKAIKHSINSVLQKRTIHTTPLRHAWANNAKHSNL